MTTPSQNFRRTHRRTTLLRILTALLVWLIAVPPSAWAAPKLSWVARGRVRVSQEGDLTLIRASNGAIINYSTFLVGRDETVRFVQPHRFARVLNKVDPRMPVVINGKLEANGIVYIMNPSGIFFGDESIVNVGKLVAVAGDMSDRDFRRRIDRFTNVTGPVENKGTIDAAAATLIGNTVANHGKIVSDGGLIALVAGNDVVLRRFLGRLVIHVDHSGVDPQAPAIQQTGTLDAGSGTVRLTAGDAYSLAINHTGVTRGRDIDLHGGDGAVIVAGTLDASDLRRGATGGDITVTGDRIALADATLDASGDSGGGRIRVGGDFQGKGSLPTARRTFVDDDSVLRADAERTGDGGDVIVWGDEATGFFGEVSARGGEESGDGGFAEISGKTLIAHGSVDLRAPHGETGTVLYDPLDIEIRGGNPGGDADGSDSDTDAETLLGDFSSGGLFGGGGSTAGRILAGDVGDGSDPFIIYESEIENTNADIQLEAERGIQATGAFVNQDVVLQSGRSLTMRTLGSEEPDVAGRARGIDLVGFTDDGEALRWVVSDGGTISLLAFADQELDGKTAIRAGELVAGGGDFFVPVGVTAATASGGIDIALIDTSGDQANPDASSVEIFAEPTIGSLAAQSQVDIGEIVARGYSVVGTEADQRAGAGGRISISTASADVKVGSIDASGGDAAAIAPGNGGNAANIGSGLAGISIIATDGNVTIGTGDQAPGDHAILARGGTGWMSDLSGEVIQSNEGGQGANVSISLTRTSAREEGVVLLVQGDVDVTGGDGRGAASDPDPDDGVPPLRTAGGRGGDILLSSPGQTVIGQFDNDVPVTITAKGGSAASGVPGEEGGSGGNGGRIRINDSFPGIGGDVSIYGRLETGGGDAGDGTGGTGRPVTIRSVAGFIDATRAVIDTSGADGAGTTFERPGQAFLDRTGGFGGDVLIVGQASTSVGTIVATGGDAPNGSGGAGGDVSVTSNEGFVVIRQGGIDTSGGEGQGLCAGECSAEDGATIGSNGGNGGFIGLATLETDGFAGLQVDGAIRSRGATGTPGDDPEATTDGAGGLVQLETSGAVEAGAQGRVEAGSVTARVGSIGANGPVTIAGDGSELSILEVEASGVVAIGLEDEIADGTDGDFAGIQITQMDAAAGTTLTRDGAAVLEVEPASGDQTVTRVDTTDMDDTVLAYRLAVPEEEGVDAPTLGLTRGNVNFGLAGGAIGNEGPLVGIGSGTAAATEGDNLKLEGTTIGTSADRIEAEGAAGASLTLIARGDAYAEVIAGSFDAVDVTQREVLGATDVILGTSDELVVSGSGTTSTVTNLQTTETGVAIAYRLDAETDPDSEEPGEATLVVENDAVNLGGDAVFASAGDVRVGTAQGIAIRTGGNGLALLADADVDGAGAVTTWNDGSGPAEIDADGGDVLLRAAEGAEVALRDGATLAAVTFSGDVAVSNASSGPGGDLVIGTVEIDDGAEADPITGAGVLSASGNARFTSDRIVLSDLETAPHVRTGGSQTFAGEVLLENARDQIIDPFEEPKTEPRHVVELEAGGDIRFEGDVVVSNKKTPDSDLEVDATLRTRAGGATYFGGDVGGAGGPGKLARLETTDAVVAGTAADTRTFTVGSAEFGGRVEGPAAMRVRASEDVHFGANVGTGSRVAGLDVEAAEIDFTGAGRVFAGDKGVLLNADDALRTEAPAVATIGTKSARLAIQTSGAFETGRYEKVSVPGELTIRASNASFGDLAATSIIVASPNIQVKGREPGPVLTGIGLFRQDRGTDIVANDITFGSVPRWDRVGTRPSFVIGNGSLNVPGVLVGFDVRRFDAASNAITPADFVGQAGEVLDLTGVGPPLTADPTREIPRTGETAFEPLAPASRSGVAPSLAPVVSAPEVLAYLRCGGSAGGASTGCSSGAAASLAATPGFSKSALATERAEEMAARYRMAIGSRQAHARLRANFKVAGRVWREAVGGGAVDGAAFYRFLRESKPFAEAVAQIDELAWLLGQSELLGLSRNDTQALQESLLREFADRANMPGLDVRALEEAVRESGIGVPSQLAAAGSQSRTRLRP